MGLSQTIVLCLVLLLIIIILLLYFFKPWRFLPSFSSSSSAFTSAASPIRPLTDGDLERPLVSDEVDVLQNHGPTLEGNHDLKGSHSKSEGLFSAPRNHGLVYKQRLIPPVFPLVQGGSVVLDVSPDSKGHNVGQTLTWQRQKNISFQEQDCSRYKETGIPVDNDELDVLWSKNIVKKGSSLTLEVTSGPSRGYCHTVTSTSKLPLTLGRVSPSDLSLKDSEVSGKHAMINWNINKKKWELTDMGSLNGTLLNQQAVHHPNSASRQWGNPVELASGDIITLGTTSNISVIVVDGSNFCVARCLHILDPSYLNNPNVTIDSPKVAQLPFDIGMVADPMFVRRGGKRLEMEDVYYYQWPLSGLDQFGLFGICDGHGGSAAAKSASKFMPEKVAGLLSDTQRRDQVLSMRDASDVLKDAFYLTEADLNHHYEGCTATVLLVWMDENSDLFAQCANVGDSACIISIDGQLIKMSADHRVTNLSERERIKQLGEALKDGETRLCGLNLARMLGDKFLKEQDARFSSEPYISEVVHIEKGSWTFALLASDGFWDVISTKKAIQLVGQAREQQSNRDGESCAEKVANHLLNEARSLRTKDNTSIIFLDFSSYRGSCDTGKVNS